MLQPHEILRPSRFGKGFEVEVALDTKDGGVGLRASDNGKKTMMTIIRRDSHKTHARGVPRPLAREQKIKGYRGLTLILSYEAICALHACLERLLYGGRMPWRPKRFTRIRPGVMYQLGRGRCRVLQRLHPVGGTVIKSVY